MSVKDLAKATGLSTTCIYHAEDLKWPHKTHVEVAALLARSLGCESYDIFTSQELSHAGRPPLTGTQVTVTMTTTVVQAFCGVHYIELPRNGVCCFCQT
jgi:hypothetical protein